MQHKTLLLERNKQIDVFDGVFPLQWRDAALDFIAASKFSIGWSDSGLPERKEHDYFIHSQFNAVDVERFDIQKLLSYWMDLISNFLWSICRT